MSELHASSPADLLLVVDDVLEQHLEQQPALVEAGAAPHLIEAGGGACVTGRGTFITEEVRSFPQARGTGLLAAKPAHAAAACAAASRRQPLPRKACAGLH